MYSMFRQLLLYRTGCRNIRICPMDDMKKIETCRNINELNVKVHLLVLTIKMVFSTRLP
jgi:hypothetical protein